MVVPSPIVVHPRAVVLAGRVLQRVGRRSAGHVRRSKRFVGVLVRGPEYSDAFSPACFRTAGGSNGQVGARGSRLLHAKSL